MFTFLQARTAAIAVAVGLCTLSCVAQELPEAPGPGMALMAKTAGPNEGIASLPLTTIAVSEARRAPGHRFFDRTSLLFTGMETAAMLADGVTTQNRLGQAQTGFQNVNGVMNPVQMRVAEADPVGKLFVKGGWPGMIAGGAMNVGADLGVRYWLHRTNHHRLERVVPLLMAASSAAAAIHNTRY